MPKVKRIDLTKKQRRKIGEYLRYVADMLELRDWTLLVMHRSLKPNSPSLATCRTFYGQKTAEIRFRQDIAYLDPEQLRTVLIHEVLHMHIDAYPLHNFHTALAGPAYDVVVAHLNEKLEYATDGIAHGISRFFALPPEL